MAARRDPAWVLAIVGWLAVGVPAWLAAPDPLAPTREMPPGLDGRSPRDLRRLPGIGEVKALAIHAETWRRRSTGEPLELEDVPGIGPLTAERVRAALEAAGDDSSSIRETAEPP